MFWAVYQVLSHTYCFTFLGILFYRYVNRGSESSYNCSTVTQLGSSRVSIPFIALSAKPYFRITNLCLQDQVAVEKVVKLEIKASQRAHDPSEGAATHSQLITTGNLGPGWPQLPACHKNYKSSFYGKYSIFRCWQPVF